MLRYLLLSIITVTCGLLIMRFSDGKKHKLKIETKTSESNDGYMQWFNETCKDPATGKIPTGIYQQSLTYAASLPVSGYMMSKADFGIWVQRGPNNVGGRTRSLAIDVNNENRMICGGVSGGIWKTEDGGMSWQKMSADTDYVPVTCIVQDKRTGKANTWYAGTGEIFGGYFPSTDYIIGNGIRKSTDNGRTWSRLASTYSSSPTYTNSFNYINRLAFNNSIDSLDVIFAATFDGIFRSTNGGNTWIRRRGIAGNWGFTEVAVDRNGVVYAALDGSFGQKGIWRSADNGQNWTNISPAWFANEVGRIVMTISPDDPNQMYFLAYTPGTGKYSGGEWHSLWKYTYKSGDGSGTGGQWEDRSSGIPADTLMKTYGSYSSQKGYCMHVRVRPGNPDEVYLGGVSLYKSTDGFKTTNAIKLIGGGRLDATDWDLQIGIPNQHGDEHDILFSPSNNKKAITVSDGGVEYTHDITANNIVWESMNSGLMTTQFYTVGIDHNSTSPIVFGGAQDNGARFVNELNYLKPWTKPSDGDGQIILPGVSTDDYFVSFQYGWLARFKLDADMNLTQAAYIAPIKQSKIALFSSPFLVDESNRKMLYYADGQFLQRNADITQIPLAPKLDSSVKITGWSLMNGCVAPDSSSITQITYAQAQQNVIYFGTNTGKLMRIRGASSATPVAENITGSNFPNGYITCVATDSKDSNSLFCVFSNFGILSVFHTNNGGTSWQPVSGNLEQQPNGAGAGPSCRWLTIAHLPDTTLYFLGTSVGLFATGMLNGSNTVWTRQGPHNIGLNWVTMMDFRTTDYTMAVSTFGAGIFTAKISSTDRTGLRQLYKESQIQLYPNPASDLVNLLTVPEISIYHFEIYTLDGRLVLKGKPEKGEPINLTGLSSGEYIITLQSSIGTMRKRLIKTG